MNSPISRAFCRTQGSTGRTSVVSKAKYAQLANTLITLLTTAEQQKKLKIEKLREIRIAETMFLMTSSLERSIDVAKETSNYLPLLVMLLRKLPSSLVGRFGRISSKKLVRTLFNVRLLLVSNRDSGLSNY